MIVTIKDKDGSRGVEFDVGEIVTSCPDAHERFSSDEIALAFIKAMMQFSPTESLGDWCPSRELKPSMISEHMVGPNNCPVGQNEFGDYVEWLDGSEEGDPPLSTIAIGSKVAQMVIRRGDLEIGAQLEACWEKVWWNRHQNRQLEREAQGLPRCLIGADTASQIEEKYGRENLGWDTFEWGLLNGKLSALSWVSGSSWADSLDT